MTRKNRLVRHAHISEAKFRALLRAFAVDLTATQIAVLTGLNRNTVNAYLTKIRRRIAEQCEQASPFAGSIEVDESFFGAQRMKGKRGRGAYGKTIVFGIFQRNGEVYPEIVPDCLKATLQAIIRGRVDLESVIHSDGWRGYAGLVDMGYQKHLRVDHGKDEFAKGTVHINGMEGFWGIAKIRLAKYRGLSRSTFYLHLKESEWRYNHRRQNLYNLLSRMFIQQPLN